MMRLYYRGASACLLMFDITDRQSFLDCIKWKRDLDSKVLLADSMPVPCLLIGNKVIEIFIHNLHHLNNNERLRNGLCL